jgi:hypothetical protein
MYAVDTNRVMIKVRCPEDRLTDVAEVLRLKMKTVDGERDMLSDQCVLYCLNTILTHYLFPNMYKAALHLSERIQQKSLPPIVTLLTFHPATTDRRRRCSAPKIAKRS